MLIWICTRKEMHAFKRRKAFIATRFYNGLVIDPFDKIIFYASQIFDTTIR